jgi:multidrug efflux system outer membrane protein
MALERQIADLTEAVEKADDRYRNGYSNFLDVLDADRELFSAQLGWAQTRALQLQSMVDVCLALGGGWEGEPAALAQNANVAEHDLSDGGRQ